MEENVLSKLKKAIFEEPEAETGVKYNKNKFLKHMIIESSFLRNLYLKISASIFLPLPPQKNSGFSGESWKRTLTEEEHLQLMKNSDSELSGLSDDVCAAEKTYELRILEGESSSDERDEEITWKYLQ
ncbi:hypothetical protein TNCV_442351 [Trichonephila clavipes]|nr:hypothetical protein TNCV_442351 [Trichonephila clavipes]